MAKVHDKYVVELAEIIKGYGNDPDINDPFCLSEFYRFYEVPNVCVSAENFKKMRPLSDYTEEIEPESISEWKKEFREYVDSLDIARDDWKGIIEYIDEVPSVQPTLYGYNIGHLELIARVLQKEDLPPERIAEALTDIGRIVAIVRDEFEETLRKAVEQCTI